MNPVISAKQLAEATRRLAELSQLEIDLPDLEGDPSAEINRDNLKAEAVLYFAAQLEALKLMSVADKVAEQFMTGLIPIGRSPGGEAIYRYIKEAPRRLTEVERRGLYARSFGFGGAEEEATPNRELSELWLRFLSSVSARKQVFKSARDLAANLSQHGYGIAHFAAVELQEDIREIIQMLSYPDVLSAYGVRDVWQLVERVSAQYLGGAVNGVRQRTLAQAGSRIILWLADNQPKLVSAAPVSLPITQESDIAHDAERWLAAQGTARGDKGMARPRARHPRRRR